jgi:hypothetical protein
MIARRTLVQALTTLALVGGALVGLSARAEGPKTQPATASAPAAQSGRVVGILVTKGQADITVKPEGTQEARRYLLAPPGGSPDPKVQAAVKAAFEPNLVAVEWRLAEQQPVVTSFQQITREQTGVVAGTVTALPAGPGQILLLEVKPDGQGFTERYWPQWVKDGFDKNLVAVIAGLKVGDKVKIAWYRDERRRVTGVQVLGHAASAPASGPAGAAR